MDVKSGKYLSIALTLWILASAGSADADSSAGYQWGAGGSSTSASVKISVNIPVKVRLGISLANLSSWSNAEEAVMEGRVINCAGIGVEEDNAACGGAEDVSIVYSMTVL